VKVLVSEVARADVRRVGQAEAIRVLRAIARFARTGDGDVKALTGTYAGRFRLRVGNYRVFEKKPEQTILVQRVLHRSQAY
jgi:mRNA interferase RelE/StbE